MGVLSVPDYKGGLGEDVVIFKDLDGLMSLPGIGALAVISEGLRVPALDSQ